MTPQNQLINREPSAPSSDSAPRMPRSALTACGGFTLVELLIVMVVIGILVGMLMVGIGGVMGTSRELAIRVEMTQMEQAVESFKTKYGFYPPSFEQFNRGTSAADLAAGAAQFSRFLNRISPNHNEGSAFPLGTVPRINVWWNKIGRHLNQATALNFWLSGLCKSKQFPLTGGVPHLIHAFNGPTQLDAGGNEVERDVFYEFKSGQLTFGVIDADVFQPGVVDGVANTNMANELYEIDEVPAGSFAATAALQQAYGPTNGNKTFLYRDAASYNLLPYAYIVDFPTTNTDNSPWNPGDPLVQENFANSKTFQIISFGMDGEAGGPFTAAELDGQITDQAARKKNQIQSFAFPLRQDVLAEAISLNPNYKASDASRAADNMTNFSGGRLDLLWINQ